jgi:hypothetical protein
MNCDRSATAYAALLLAQGFVGTGTEKIDGGSTSKKSKHISEIIASSCFGICTTGRPLMPGSRQVVLAPLTGAKLHFDCAGDN